MIRKLLFFTLLCIVSCNNLKAQYIIEGESSDSLVIDFDTLQTSEFITDSSGLWQIGNTAKTFFSQGSSGIRSVMTDTNNHYPINANSWFQIEFENIYSHYNTVINFTHKYQTDSLHDGCIIEFSTDSGVTWENVKGDCNGDTNFNWSSTILTSNLYSGTDTLLTGEQAFSGTSNGWINSRIQFFLYLPVKTTDSSSLCQLEQEHIIIRFRFVSDSIPDSLDGWIISRIMIENDKWYSVDDIGVYKQLSLHPNPSYDGLIRFPQLQNEKSYTMEIINSMGQTVMRSSYKHEIDLSQHPKGLYFYRVTDNVYHYSGKILLE